MKTIGIQEWLSMGHRRLLEALGEILCIRFERRSLENDEGIDGWVINEADQETFRLMVHKDLPCYMVVRRDQLMRCGDSSIIEFSTFQNFSGVFSGRQILTDEASKVLALPSWLQDGKTLASKAGVPIWTVRDINGRFWHHFVSLTIPELDDNEPIFKYFHGQQFLPLLPLFLFLRALVEDQRWEEPPNKACFMFDDPNLHWPKYGYIDYSKMLQHAQIFNYHVSYATIPLDTWFTHKPTASLFVRNQERISLLMHGNTHIAHELARFYKEGQETLILRQALRRIEALEDLASLEVSRVMAPPHGACSEIFLREMAQLGFESACVSGGSLRRYNGKAPWLKTFGMRPSDIIGGLPVFPRFPISKDCHNSILLSALLHQPIIPMGHHLDIASGIQVLDELATFVNSLGTIQWADMTRICRSHYARRFEGNTMLIRMYTRRIEVSVPDDVNEILVERSWEEMGVPNQLVWRKFGDDVKWWPLRLHQPIPISENRRIEISSWTDTSSFVDVKTFGRFHVWPILRRQLTEARDRVIPSIRKVSSFLNK